MMRSVVAIALLALLVGCSDESASVAPAPAESAPTNAASVAVVHAAESPAAPVLGPVVERRIVTVTNIVTVTRTVLVTNVIGVSETSLAGARPESLSSRKTAPYVVTCDVMADARVRRELSDCGVRVISVEPRTRAIVEASEASVARIREKGVFAVRALGADEKVAPGVSGKVTIYPLSLIDAKSVSDAVAALGAEASADRVGGRSVVRATLNESQVAKIAARGDVRRIERSEP